MPGLWTRAEQTVPRPRLNVKQFVPIISPQMFVGLIDLAEESHLRSCGGVCRTTYIEPEQLVPVDHLAARHERVDVLQSRKIRSRVCVEDEKIRHSPRLYPSHILPAVHVRVVGCGSSQRFPRRKSDSVKQPQLQVQAAARQAAVGSCVATGEEPRA